MKTVLLFPGLDALFQASKFKRWLPLEEPSKALNEASQLLSDLTGTPEDLGAFLQNHSRPHIADFDRTLVALTALQVGIARNLQINFKWDILLGCSHGDIARSVIAEVISFKTAVEVLWAFAELRKTCPEGYAASVRPIEGILTPEHMAWLDQMGAPVSVWSEENATIAGQTALMQSIVSESRARGLKVKPVLRYPVHSPAMKPAVDYLQSQLHRWPFGQPRWPIFSSVIVDYLKTPEGVIIEALAGAVNPIRWTEALLAMKERENITRFLNVGPCNSLTGWMLHSDALKDIELVDAWDVLGTPST